MAAPWRNTWRSVCGSAQADDALSVYITAKVNVMDKSLDEYLALRERFCPEAPGTPELLGQVSS